MKTGQLAIVLVRLAAVWIVVTTIQYATSDIQFYEGANTLAIALSHLITLILAGLLWLFPAHVALSIASDDSALEADDALAARFFSLGVAFLGLYLLVYGALDAIYFAILVFREQRELGVIAEDHRAGLVISVIQVPAGIALILGRRKLLQLLYRLRHEDFASR